MRIQGNTLIAYSLPSVLIADLSSTPLEEITLPTDITGIGESVFGIPFSTTVTVPLASFSGPGVLTVGKEAFSYCEQLASVSLPAVKEIGLSAFLQCTSLAAISFTTVEIIEESAFSYCTSLASVTLPAAKSIGSQAFQNCASLAAITLPLVTSIGNNAFQGTVVATVTLGAEKPLVGTNIFQNAMSRTVAVMVPAASVNTYNADYSDSDSTAGNWGNAFRGKGWNYPNVIAIEPAFVVTVRSTPTSVLLLAA